MTFSVLDRILLLNCLPPQGDITTVKIVRQLREALSFSEDEHAALNLVQKDGQVTWTHTAEVVKDIEVGPKAVALIERTLKAMSDKRELTEQHLDLYERFVE